jgi:CubicO group peptidase (beta-lactamase class C family)
MTNISLQRVSRSASAVAIAAVSLFSSAVLAQEEPTAATALLFLSPEEQTEVFKNTDLVFPAREIRAGETVRALPSAVQDLSEVTYTVGETSYTLDDFMEEQRAGGLLVLHKGEIAYERYGLNNDENSRWIGFSVSKSVTSMLLGAAIQDAYINSVDDAVTDYLPRLIGSAYEGATIKNILNMTSGVGWNEDYADPSSDVSRAAGLNAMELFDYLNTLEVVAEPGEVFNYSTGETNLVGAIVRAAVGNNLSAYLEHKIWQPFGMESDATWLVDDKYRAEIGGCCINATLRDYGRIGLFALSDGVLADGTRVLPEGWMRASTSPSEANSDYGYQWWLFPDGTYAAMGVFGQLIWINEETQTVIVTHSAWDGAWSKNHSDHRWAMIAAVHGAVQTGAAE